MSAWIPIALGRDVPPGTTRGVLLDGAEVLIWRDSDGNAHVWEDRCPHRGMRLSFGFVRNNSLNCLYHGWQYGAASHCLRIPAHPDLTVPATIRANAYASGEAGGMIWMSFEPEGEPPMLPELIPVVSIAVDADPRTAIAGGQAIAPNLVTVTLGDGTLFIGWHQVRAGKVMLHAAATVEADIAAAMHRMREFRRLAEMDAVA